ncbi:MAG: hypothetical protein ACE5HI_14330 [bacterium]
MSYDWNDLAYNQWIEELNTKHMYEGAVELFTTERLRSAYIQNPTVAELLKPANKIIPAKAGIQKSQQL